MGGLVEDDFVDLLDGCGAWNCCVDLGVPTAARA